MAISAALCNSYKQEILSGTHSSADTYKLALYTSAATLGATTTAYAATNEVGASGSYSAGGVTLTGFSVSGTGATARLDFTIPVITSATITARGALVYNSTKSNKAVAVLDFGADITSTSGNFTVTAPAVGDSTSLIRIS
jgi:hypothetical protein